jgi:hypothetical protein
MLYRFTILGRANCWDGCGGEILVRLRLDYEGPSDRESLKIAHCTRCGLVYKPSVIIARSNYAKAPNAVSSVGHDE